MSAKITVGNCSGFNNLENIISAMNKTRSSPPTTITIQGGAINRDECKALRDLMLSPHLKGDYGWCLYLESCYPDPADDCQRLLTEAFSAAPIRRLVLSRFNSTERESDRRMLRCVFSEKRRDNVGSVQFRYCVLDVGILPNVKAWARSANVAEYEISGRFTYYRANDDDNSVAKITSFLSEIYQDVPPDAVPKTLKLMAPASQSDLYENFAQLRGWDDLEAIKLVSLGQPVALGIHSLTQLRELTIRDLRQRTAASLADVGLIKLLEEGNLESLSIGLKLQEDSILTLFEALKKNTTLRRFDIQFTVLESTAAAEALVDCLSANKSIQQILLHKNTCTVHPWLANRLIQLLSTANINLNMICADRGMSFNSILMPYTFRNWVGRRLLVHDTVGLLLPLALGRIRESAVIAANRTGNGHHDVTRIRCIHAHISRVCVDAMYHMLQNSVGTLFG